ncbi:MAG: hypothetical protein AB7E51_07940 [Pseudodesulfovibrio sp.]
MELASSCEHCGVENDCGDFVHYEGGLIFPDCHAALAVDEENNV